MQCTGTNLYTRMAESEIEQKLAQLPTKVAEAKARIETFAWHTPLMFSQYLSDLGSARVYLKLENEQLTGAFKIRGALNKMLLLKENQPELLKKGVITASSGNHGIGCLEAAKKCGCSVALFCSHTVDDTKLALMKAYGGTVTKYGMDCVEAEIKARQTAEENGQIFVSPYNDWDIVAGQGTIGVEIYEDLPEVDCVLIAVGGGGLIGGIASYLKSKDSNIRIVGCQPRNSKVMYESVQAGHIVHEASLDTLSDGTTGDIEDGTITIPVCSKHVDEWILVEEDQISRAVYTVLDKHHKVIEGAAGVVVAAYMYNIAKFDGMNVAIVICGGNMATTTLKQIIDTNIPASEHK